MQTEEEMNPIPAEQTASEPAGTVAEQMPEQAASAQEPAVQPQASAEAEAAHLEQEEAARPAAEQPSPAEKPSGDEEPFELVPTSEFKQIVETLLFITDRPLKPTRIADVIDGADARRVRAWIL